MANPYKVLGISKNVGDQEVRKAYLALVRQHPPERSPEMFQRVRSAYTELQDQRLRLRFQLFNATHGESLDEWMEELQCETATQRLSLKWIRDMLRPG